MPPPQPQPTTKNQWRFHLKQRLTQRPPENLRGSLAGCYGHNFLFKQPSKPFPHTLLTYAAGPDEPQTASLHRLAKTVGFQLAYPVCEEHHTLNFYRVTGFTEMVPDRYGIPAPDRPFRTDDRRVDPQDVEHILIPGLAFDPQNGNRLGRGAGYYDRFLARCPQALRIGVCLEDQLIEGLPAEPHDIPMHALVTPDRAIRIP